LGDVEDQGILITGFAQTKLWAVCLIVPYPM
jgi:hypothetical protein